MRAGALLRNFDSIQPFKILSTSDLQEIVTETDPQGTGQVSFEVVGRLMQESEGSRASILASGEGGVLGPLPSLPPSKRKGSFFSL
jgi:hypothetical protein